MPLLPPLRPPIASELERLSTPPEYVGEIVVDRESGQVFSGVFRDDEYKWTQMVDGDSIWPAEMYKLAWELSSLVGAEVILNPNPVPPPVNPVVPPHTHSLPYDIEFFISGELVVDEVVGLFLVNRALSIVAEADSSAKCLMASTGTVVYTIKQNGVSIGTVTYSAGNTTGAVDFTTIPVSLARGDVLSVTSQSGEDATIANVIIAVATEFESDQDTVNPVDPDPVDPDPVDPSVAPIADFTQDVTTGSAPLAVTFTSTSTGGSITTYLWSFGNGATSSLPSPTYMYPDPGSYSVTLTVTGPGGTSSKTVDTLITVTDWLEDPDPAPTETPTGEIILHLPLDSYNSFFDRTGNFELTAINGATISNEQTKYRDQSAKIPAGAYAFYEYGAAISTTDDYTVELWLYSVEAPNDSYIFAGNLWAGEEGMFSLMIRDSRLRFGDYAIGSVPYTTNAWHHVAVSRQSGTLRVFIDGAVDNQIPDDVKELAANHPLYLADSSYKHNCFMSDVLITKGHAKYTGAFTPPTSKFLTVKAL